MRLAILILCSTLALAAPNPKQITGKVVSITDGDTIKVLVDQTEVKVRLWGIDTPERRQHFGNRAQELTGKLAHEKTVTVIVRDIDRYGRTVGEVMLPDGHNLGHELVRAGLACSFVSVRSAFSPT